MSQTDPLPDVDPAPLSPPREPVTGDSHAYLIGPLCAFAAQLGYPVAWVDGLAAEGVCDRRGKAIRLRGGMAANRQVATLIHELAHALIEPGAALGRAAEEVVVEATAHIVASSAGLDTSCDSVPYIAGWATDHDAPLGAVREALALIDQLADRLQRVIDSGCSRPANGGSPAG